MMMLRKYQLKNEKRTSPKDGAKQRVQREEAYHRVFGMIALKTESPNPWEVLKQKPSFQLNDVTLHDIVYAMQHASANLDVNEEQAKKDLDFLGNAYLAKIEIMHIEVKRETKNLPKPRTQEEKDIAHLANRSREQALQRESNISYSLIVDCEEITKKRRMPVAERQEKLGEQLEELERVTEAFEPSKKKCNFFRRLSLD